VCGGRWFELPEDVLTRPEGLDELSMILDVSVNVDCGISFFDPATAVAVTETSCEL